jgi:hypothetical protein
MTFDRFKDIFFSLEKQPLFNDSIPSAELDEYYELFHSSNEYADWAMQQRIEASGLDIPSQCCTDMQFQLIEYYLERKQLDVDPDYINYDSVVVYNTGHRVYGIPIHDGGSSFITINFCPWCGQRIGDPN